MRGPFTLLFSLGLAASPAALAAPDDEPGRVAFYREAPDSYAGVGLFSANIDQNDLTHKPGGLHVRLGGMVDEHWGLEVRLARGLWHETESVGATDIQVDVSHLAGVYFTTRWAFDIPLLDIPSVPRFFVQGQAGLADMRLEIDTETCTPLCTTDSESEGHSDLSWGIGTGLEVRVPKVTHPVSLSLEYMDYGEKDGIAITTVETGIQFFF